MNLFLLQLLFACSSCKPKPPKKIIDEDPVKIEKKLDKVKEENVTKKDRVMEQLTANFQRVYFEVASSELNDESRAALDDNIEIMKKELSVHIQIQGHADERGTTEFNVALGIKRAKKIQQYFILNDIAESRIDIRSYGEEVPVAHGSFEEAWSQNRRCEFVITNTKNPNIKGTQ